MEKRKTLNFAQALHRANQEEAARRAEAAAQAEAERAAQAPPPPGAPPPLGVAPPPSGAPPENTQPPVQSGGAPPIVAPPPSGGAIGYLKRPYELEDRILTTLRPPEQSVLSRLFRLSHGFRKTTCTVSIGKLASACVMGKTQVRLALTSLEARGHIKRLNTDLGNSIQDARGIEFEVLPALAIGGAPPLGGPPPNGGAPPLGGPNILKALKENNKRDCSRCPDCKGTGWCYPHGVKKGVARCEHKNMVSE